MKHALARVAAVATTGVLALSALAAPANAAPADTGAQWTVKQLTDGVVVFPQYGNYSDYGMTTDAALALDAIGGQDRALRQIRSALAKNVDAWTGSGASAGSTAKALVAAQVTGGKPRDFGGANLVRQLNERVSDAAPTVGRLQDDTAGEDYANVFSQALGARGLARAGSAKADEVIGFLLDQQCAPGYFRLYFAADKTAADQSCDAGDPATTAAPDTDATAVAVLSLDALPKSARTKAVRSALTEAVSWLKETQKRNGSFGGGTATEAANSNSTGLAGWALGVTGNCGRASEAARWVRRLQVRGDVAGTPLRGQKGAIAYSRASYTTAQDEGITDGTEYEWRKATFDAAPVLSYLSC